MEQNLLLASTNFGLKDFLCGEKTSKGLLYEAWELISLCLEISS